MLKSILSIREGRKNRIKNLQAYEKFIFFLLKEKDEKNRNSWWREKRIFRSSRGHILYMHNIYI